MEAEVWLLDRAYANPAGVAAIRNSGAHIIVRYNRGSIMGGRRLCVAQKYQRSQKRFAQPVVL